MNPLFQVFRDFITGCLTEAESDRCSIQQLSKHAFVVDTLVDSLGVSSSAANRPLENQSSYITYNEADVHLPIFPDHVVLGTSR